MSLTEEWIDKASVDELRDGLRTCRGNWVMMAQENDGLRAALTASESRAELLKRAASVFEHSAQAAEERVKEQDVLIGRLREAFLVYGCSR